MQQFPTEGRGALEYASQYFRHVIYAKQEVCGGAQKPLEYQPQALSINFKVRKEITSEPHHAHGETPLAQLRNNERRFLDHSFFPR